MEEIRGIRGKRIKLEELGGTGRNLEEIRGGNGRKSGEMGGNGGTWRNLKEIRGGKNKTEGTGRNLEELGGT